MSVNFHDIRFPTAISRGAQGGPERRTDVVTLGSGFEERNSRWANSRHMYNAGYGVKTLDDLHAVIAFFEERRGRLHGFRWRDHMDWKSCAPSATPAMTDQILGTGTGTLAVYQLKKTYGALHAPWARTIKKPVSGTALVAVAGIAKTLGTHVTLDAAAGTLTFLAGNIPSPGQQITAGFEFDVPVRFDTDKLEVSVSGFRHGAIPNIPIIEVRI
jgi:uncharacterized protein (TIGR02217 family)